MKLFFALTAGLIVSSAAFTSTATPSKPTNDDATKAIRAMLNIGSVSAILGTCKPALKPQYKGQTACTVNVVSSGGTSETQVDFHWTGKEWAAEPSESQDILPFPDPALAKHNE